MNCLLGTHCAIRVLYGIILIARSTHGESNDDSNTNSCQTSIILKLTNTFETSHQEFQYDPCVQLSDDHGYSAGIVQFTTGTGSAQQVIQYYSERVYPNEFTPMNATLSAINAQLQADATEGGGLVASVAGLEGYCDAWVKASTNPEFRDAQLAVLTKMYFVPSQKVASGAGLSFAVSIGQIYDSTIQLGAQGTKDLLQMVTSRRGIPGPQNEIEWLNEYLDDREKKLTSMGGAYAPTVTRVKSYRELVKGNDPNFRTMPVHALDNDGKALSINCDGGMALPGSPAGAAGGSNSGHPGNSLVFSDAWNVEFQPFLPIVMLLAVHVCAVLMWRG
ncbi:hypothetical protein BASA50_003191 [Batrachochytrium salamandrivorans]|uniref:Chitosanase n=1 Tax=Batrachochytrium salamandrivorans TaxID=1357716 RepID=A0ABQ8FJ46_9FUNG|nr:hypothetical protein BASA62_008445 [Batrachochytrium salamandrivorans]KAH6589154.1 hypothetical protein BASA61_005718 [Batrachochytrium salamandrivorans]KAH6599163.1 hypothetical protein BASA50_003191 [Batrachochytrium salamandrivorans]KAJ1342908.1 hypothetical protein BSLG_002565 [Batrachochytrium salamandrivorans]